MSCCVTVRARDAMMQWNLDEWTTLVVIASLSAEPTNLAELMDAVRRYQPEHQLQELGCEVTELEHAVTDDWWCIVDLIGKTVVAGGGYEVPDRNGAYEPSEGEDADGFPIAWLDTPADWEFCSDKNDWREDVAKRAATASKAPPIDARAILYGKPLLGFLVDEVKTIARDHYPQNENDTMKCTREIHARWLMSARDDLRGQTPRQILLADCERIQHDLEHRSFQWTRQGHAARPLAADSAAYRFGGFGTIEVIVYFDLVRTLLDKAWKLVGKKRSHERSWLVEQLSKHRDRWMQSPFEDGEMKMTSQELVDTERKRLPITGNMSSGGGPLDCDCPICRAEADGVFGSGPMFLWFDGHHLELEDEFAFSMTASYEEWKSQQQSYESMADEIRATRQDSDAPRLNPESQSLIGESVWKSTFVDWDQMAGPGSSPRQSMFALAFPVAELVSDLKQRTQSRDHLRRLNDAYDDLRRASGQDATGTAARHLGQTLEDVCETYPELTSKCADLQSHLDEVLRRLV